MATMTQQTAVDADVNAENENTSAWVDNASFMIAGNTSASVRNGIIRFPSTPGISSGDTINSATLAVWVDTLANSPSVTIYAEDADSPEAVGGTATLPSARTFTTASVSLGTPTTDQFNNFTVTSHLAEVVARPGFSGGIAFIFNDEGSSAYNSVWVDDPGGTGSNDPTLDADYTVAGASPTNRRLINGGLINHGLINAGLIQ